MNDLKEMMKQFGDNFKYIAHIDPEYSDYALSVPDQLNKLIGNLKYKAKYMLNLNEVETDEYVINTLNSSLANSEKAKLYNQSHPKS